MTSDAFRAFLRQLHAAGPDKGDGFDGRHVDGLTPTEREEAWRLLRGALARGDGTAAAGLVLLDRAAAPAALRAALDEAAFADGTGANIAGELWALTGDAASQRELARYLGHPGPGTPMVALSYLRESPRSPALAGALAEFVVRDPEPRRRAVAAGMLLYWLGLVPSPDDAYRLCPDVMRAAAGPDARAREATVRALGA